MSRRLVRSCPVGEPLAAAPARTSAVHRWRLQLTRSSMPRRAPGGTAGDEHGLLAGPTATEQVGVGVGAEMLDGDHAGRDALAAPSR